MPARPAGISRRPAAIERLKRESGGASRQTWSFDAVVDGKRHGLILRRDPPTTVRREGKPAPARARHWTAPPSFACWPPPTKAACGRREVLFELTPQDGLGEGFVMQRVDGTAIARKLLRDPPYEKARTMIAGQLGEILARIHAVDLGDLPPLVHREAADHIAGMRRALDALEPAATGLRAGALLARPAPAAADRQAIAGARRLPHRQLSRRRERA